MMGSAPLVPGFERLAWKGGAGWVLFLLLALCPPAAAQGDLSAAAEMLGNGRLKEAEAELVEVLAREETAPARDLLGVVLSRQGRLAEAERQFRRAIELSPESATARQHLGRVYLQQGRLEEALAELRAAADLSPLERDLALQLAEAEAATGQREAAEALLQSVVERFDSVRAMLDLARLQARRGDQDAAARGLRRALEIAPNSEELLSAYARISLVARAPIPAIRALEPLTRMHPRVADHAYLLGVARLQLGENESAIESLERARQLEPDRIQTLTALGLAFNSGKQFAEARAILERALIVDPGNAEALAALAEAEEGLGEYAAARGHALAALQNAPNHAGAHLVLGKVHMNQQEYATARDYLVKAVAADATSPKAHYQLSLAFARLGDSEASKRHLELYRKTQREAEEHLIELRTKAGLGISGMKR